MKMCFKTCRNAEFSELSKLTFLFN